jgi:preprotein translocase subunit SecY
MNGNCAWHALAAELEEVIQTAAPRVAVVGAVIVALVAVPMLLRVWVFVPL